MELGSFGPPLRGVEPAAGRSKVLNKTDSEEKGFDQALAQNESREPKKTQESSGSTREDSRAKESSTTRQQVPPLGLIKKPSPQAKQPQQENTVGSDPIQKFMDSVESELGISPARLVGAMGELSEEELMDSPAESVEPLMQELNLGTHQRPAFQARYLEMVQAWENQPSQADEGLEPDVLAAATAAAPHTMLQNLSEKARLPSQSGQLPEASPRELLNRSIDRMNQHFFMAKDFSKASVLGEGGEAIEELNSGAQDDLSSESQLAAGTGLMGETDSHVEGALNQSQGAARVPGIGFQGGTQVSAKLGELKGLERLERDSADGLDLQQLADQVKEQSAKDSDFFSQGEQSSSGEAQADSLTGEPLRAGAEHSFDQEIQSQLGQGLSSLAPNAPGRTQALSGAGAAQTFSMMSAEESATQNVSNMIEQARFIAKEGGGDMKVRLTPEGLGQVDLQVSVVDGQVSVSMVADTMEARELLEHYKEELKTGLLEHKISVNEIKVGSSQQLGQEDFTQTGQDREQSQELARQFMEEFRHQNHRSRKDLFQIPGLKGYNKSGYKDGLAPLGQGSAAVARTNEGGRIHVVA